jgi:hypothetical protein
MIFDGFRGTMRRDEGFVRYLRQRLKEAELYLQSRHGGYNIIDPDGNIVAGGTNYNLCIWEVAQYCEHHECTTREPSAFEVEHPGGINPGPGWQIDDTWNKG